jgi:uroporphyrinogen decarboxylase
MKTLKNTFLNKKNEKIPVWLMRQAGRYLPEYRKIRENIGSFLEFCYNPELAAEVTLQPIRRFNFDAAIIFSDILVIPDALGMEVRFEKNEGPKLKSLSTEKEINNLNKNRITERLDKVYEAIKIVKNELPKNTTLIGFAGSPWTIATYMIQGGSSKDFQEIKKMAYFEEKTFKKLIDILVESISIHLINQIEAGAEVIQLFDSWAGVLSKEQFFKWVIEPTKEIITNIREKYPNIPIIGFPRLAGIFYKDYLEQTQVNALSTDFIMPTEWIKNNLSGYTIIQGNLDPILLLGDQKILKENLDRILSDLANQRYIFNLGHGILPSTPIENVEFLVDTIRNYKI